MILALLPLPASAGEILERENCGNCHRLQAPPDDARSVEAFDERRGPDLFYAGSKYRPEWLRAWLIAPERIRPAGLAPYRHAKTVEGKDRLDPTGLPDHPKVSPSEADAVVAELVALDWGSERLPETLPVAPPVPRMLAEMNFVKFKGCASCHRVAPDFGGLSGPQLY
ncbi:MAG TPA: hypothetical protein PKI99_08970, partial [Terrimesophilobacter sp.]|nr:hypothetical protein [Terrimesophilobacter sp.]